MPRDRKSRLPASASTGLLSGLALVAWSAIGHAEPGDVEAYRLDVPPTWSLSPELLRTDTPANDQFRQKAWADPTNSAFLLLDLVTLDTSSSARAQYHRDLRDGLSRAGVKVDEYHEQTSGTLLESRFRLSRGRMSGVARTLSVPGEGKRGMAATATCFFRQQTATTDAERCRRITASLELRR